MHASVPAAIAPVAVMLLLQCEVNVMLQLPVKVQCMLAGGVGFSCEQLCVSWLNAARDCWSGGDREAFILGIFNMSDQGGAWLQNHCSCNV